MRPGQESDMASEPFISSAESSRSPNNEDQTENKAKNTPATRLHRSAFVAVGLVALYAALVLFSWIVICKLTYRPITANHYGVWISKKKVDGYGWTKAETMLARYKQNERWYQAARVAQAIAGVLTIPLTSAVCSSAAVVYLQYSRDGRPPTLSLRKMMTLADRGWTDIATYCRLLRGKYPRYGSTFLIWAVLLHILGALISPLQQLFLSTESIKIPTFPTEVDFLLDIPDKFEDVNNGAGDPTVNILREYLTSWSGNDKPSQLWAEDSNCTRFGDITTPARQMCSDGIPPLGKISMLTNPFIAQLSREYNTGLIQQFLPRFNASTRYENISSEEFPTNCDKIPGALSIYQSNTPTSIRNDTSEDLSWALHACMPTDVRITPWKNTRARQDFTEVLFLNISLSRDLSDYLGESRRSFIASQYIRVTVNTTAGYFELPNYMNGEKAGPLLRGDPTEHCGNSCYRQGITSNDIYNHEAPDTKKKRGNDTMPGIEEIQLTWNKGPLLTTALALFGPNSWLDLVNRYANLYEHRNLSTKVAQGLCIDLSPFGRLLSQNSLGSFDMLSRIGEEPCIHPQPQPIGGEMPGFYNTVEAGQWLHNLRLGHITDLAGLGDHGYLVMEDMFNIAAYLSYMAWMTDTTSAANSLIISYDMGSDSQKPSISLAGIIVVSILIGIYLMAILATAIYASWFPRWTGSLDSFSLLRLGSSISEKVPLKVSVDDDRVKALDELPGWIGSHVHDGETRSKEISGISLGGSSPLTLKSRYEAYRLPLRRKP